MFSTAKAYTLSSELNRMFSVTRSVSVCINFKSSDFISPTHKRFKITCQLCFLCRDLSKINVTRWAVKRNIVSFWNFRIIHIETAVIIINFNITAAGYTACTHSAGNNSSVTCHAASWGQNTFSSVHTLNILRRRFQTYKNNLFASLDRFNTIFSSKINLTASSTWWRCKTFYKHISFFKFILNKCWMKQRIKLLWLNL